MIFITKRSDMSSISVEVSNFDERLYDNMYEFIEDYVTEMNTLYDEKKTKYFLIFDTKIQIGTKSKTARVLLFLVCTT